MLANVILVKWYFISLTIYTMLMNILLILFKDRPPSIVARLALHRKFRYNNAYLNYLEIPRSVMMTHAYVYGTLYTMVILYVLTNVYFLSKPVPQTFAQLLDLVATAEERTPTVNATAAFLGCVLLCCQVWKRLRESAAVCVYSECKVNITQYFIAAAYYASALTAIISEAPGFEKPSSGHRVVISVSDLSPRIIVGVIMFYWGWCNQYRSAVILANLRKNEDGMVVTHKYRIPTGGLFEVVSAPHMFCEIVMYFALNLVLWGHSIWPYTFFWVLSDQTQIALRNHWWYKSTFKDYPKERKAVIPYIL